MVGLIRRLSRRFGYDIAPFPGGGAHWPRLVSALERHGIDCVLDVGANIGQYASAIRKNGYGGRIVSFEPLTGAHAQLVRAAAGDPHWQVAPRAAVGAAAGSAEIHVSPESDMSSILPLDRTAHDRLESTRPTGVETAPVITLGAALEAHAPAPARVFAKSDTQGYEDRVLDGIGDAWDRITGLQVELSIQPIYEGQPDHLPLLQRLADRGLRPHLVIPGYWSRHYGRMLEYDMVFFRD